MLNVCTWASIESPLVQSVLEQKKESAHQWHLGAASHDSLSAFAMQWGKGEGGVGAGPGGWAIVPYLQEVIKL